MVGKNTLTLCNHFGYTIFNKGAVMIKNFLHKGLEKLFLDGTSAGVDAKHTPKLLRLLDRLNAAEDVRDMQFPGSGLHPLKGDLKNFWAVKVSGAWRLLFRFTDKNAHDVDYKQYH